MEFNRANGVALHTETLGHLRFEHNLVAKSTMAFLGSFCRMVVGFMVVVVVVSVVFGCVFVAVIVLMSVFGGLLSAGCEYG